MFPLSNLLSRLIRIGTLEVIDADGGTHKFQGNEPGPSVTMKLSDRKLYRSLFLNPELIAGEAYMDGTMTFPEFFCSGFSRACVAEQEPAGRSVRRFSSGVTRRFARDEAFPAVQSDRKGTREHRPSLRYRK